MDFENREETQDDRAGNRRHELKRGTEEAGAEVVTLHRNSNSLHRNSNLRVSVS